MELRGFAGGQSVNGIAGRWPILLVLACAACGGTTATNAVGSGGDSSDAAGIADGGASNVDDGGADSTPEPASPLSGTWVGAIENYMAMDGSGALTLTIPGDPSSGKATFGRSAPPAPATDPDTGYPPGAHIFAPFQPYPGFPFAFVNASFDGQRLHFGVVAAELWKSWCELQTPVLDETDAGPKYFCAHDWVSASIGAGCVQTDPQTMQQVPIDCDKLQMCRPTAGFCVCDDAKCSSDTYLGIQIDLTVAPPNADGTVGGLDSSLHKVHLTKQ
jgi:hypothetical protein